MTKPEFRSRSWRKVYVKIPSNKSSIHFERHKNSSSICAICKKPLRGTITNNVNKFSKTQKRPERPYGGYICHSCLEKLIKSSMRGTS